MRRKSQFSVAGWRYVQYKHSQPLIYSGTSKSGTNAPLEAGTFLFLMLCVCPLSAVTFSATGPPRSPKPLGWVVGSYFVYF